MNRAVILLTRKIICCLGIISCTFLFSCKKDSFIITGDALIATSVDSLKFDTVFTSVGSITQSFKISNLNDQKLLLTKVQLIGGASSSFKINVNGYEAPTVNNLEIAAGDSIYVFVTANINPNAANLPFIVRDSIEISYNGNKHTVQLEAFGQNANFLRNKIIKGNITWTNNLPYVILGSLLVDTGASLTIDPGCKVYAHADAPIIVDGTLITNGTSQEQIIFSGDRLDEHYRSFPASWPGIYFRGSSRNNILHFTTIKNAYQAIVAEQPSGTAKPKITMQQCIIDNAYDAGILCVNSSLQANNCLISNCGKNVQFIYGGNYSLTNCTVVSYSTYISHKNPVLTVSNYASQGGTILSADLAASFRNCIFWGEESNKELENEVSVTKQGVTNFVVAFDHCLYRAVSDPANSTINAAIKNIDPAFDSVDVEKGYFNFRITKNSNAPGLDKGVFTSFPKDLDDKPRNVGLTDIGAYEKQ